MTLTCDDMYRIEDLAHRLAGALADDEITVRIIGAAETGPCAECPDDPAGGERVAGDVIVRWGYARPIYKDWLCSAHLRRFLTVHVRRDQARPVVDIPATLGEPDVMAYPASGPYSAVPCV